MKSRLWTCGGLALSALIFAGVALAQDDAIPRRIDPGDTPPPSTGELSAPWSIVDVTGQTPRTSLGNLAVDSWGGVYVWAVRVVPIPMRAAMPMTFDDPTPRREVVDPVPGMGALPLTNGDAMIPLPRRADPGEPPFPDEGLGPPVVPVLYATVSTLYHYDNGVLTPELEVTGETAASVIVSRSGDVFASTDLEDGSVHAYRRMGGVWGPVDVPKDVQGPAGAMAGEDIIFFRAGNSILRWTGEHFSLEVQCGDMPGMDGLVYLGDGQYMVPCACGLHFFDGQSWVEVLDPTAPHIHSLWGGRDPMGELHLFAAGCNAEHTRLEVFQYIENQTCVPDGYWQLVDIDPLDGDSDVGTAGRAVWGAGVHDMYLAGTVHQNGHLYGFDGAGWSNITPLTGLPPMVDVGGTPWGDVWVSLVDGRLLHRQAGEVPIHPAADPVLPFVGTRAPTAADEPLLTVSRDAAGMQTARFELAGAGPVTVEIFDLAGRMVATLENGTLPAGTYQRSWNASRAPSGIYFCRLRAGAVQATQKLFVQR